MKDSDYSPSAILVMLGSLHFEHEGSNDVLSVTISRPEELAANLEHSAKNVEPSSVDNLHAVILKSSSLSTLYDNSILSTFYNPLKPGAKATAAHVLGSAEMPVKFGGDCSKIRMSILLSGLRLEQEGLTEGDEGGWTTLTARKQESEQEEGDGDDEA
jgi:hypothetical protein